LQQLAAPREGGDDGAAFEVMARERREPGRSTRR